MKKCNVVQSIKGCGAYSLLPTDLSSLPTAHSLSLLSWNPFFPSPHDLMETIFSSPLISWSSFSPSFDSISIQKCNSRSWIGASNGIYLDDAILSFPGSLKRVYQQPANGPDSQLPSP